MKRLVQLKSLYLRKQFWKLGVKLQISRQMYWNAPNAGPQLYGSTTVVMAIYGLH